MIPLKSMNAALVILLLASACQTTPVSEAHQKKEATAEIILAEQFCSRQASSATATWIDTSQQLQMIIKKLRGNALEIRPINATMTNFQHDIALFVEMGQRPSLGYHLTLAEHQPLRIKQKQAYLTLNWIQPAASATNALAISSPCLLLRLERGNYTSVHILDEQGNLKATTGKTP